jgi:hypothetical protein
VLLTIAVALPLAAGTGATPAGAATAKAKHGILSGTVTGKLPSGKGDTTVRATNIETGVISKVVRPTKSGRFTLKLPAGGYAVTATVVSAGGALSAKTLAVSLRSGQKRTGIAFKPGRVSATASREYVTEKGAKRPGTTAVMIQPFTGDTGHWRTLAPGLSTVLATRLQRSPKCSGLVRDNASMQPFLLKTLKSKGSKFFNGKTETTRDFVEPDIIVTGSANEGKDGAILTLTFTDTATKTVIDTVSAHLSTTGKGWLVGAKQLTKVVAERVCRAPASYGVALHVDGAFESPAYRATGVIESTIEATSSGTGRTWNGAGTYAWTGVKFASKSSCDYRDVQATGGSWAASLVATTSAGGQKQVKVNWGLAAADLIKLTTATAYCAGLPAVPDQPGPSQVGLTPSDFTLPAEGGVGKITGGLNGVGIGFFNTGTLTVTPIWKYAPLS